MAVGDDREAIVNGLITRKLQGLSEEVIDEGRLAGRVGAKHRHHRPPGDLCRVRCVLVEDAESVRYFI